MVVTAPTPRPIRAGPGYESPRAVGVTRKAEGAEPTPDFVGVDAFDVVTQREHNGQ